MSSQLDRVFFASVSFARLKSDLAVVVLASGIDRHTANHTMCCLSEKKKVRSLSFWCRDRYRYRLSGGLLLGLYVIIQHRPIALVCVSEQDPDALLVQGSRIGVYSVLEGEISGYLEVLFVQA